MVQQPSARTLAPALRAAMAIVVVLSVLAWLQAYVAASGVKTVEADRYAQVDSWRSPVSQQWYSVSKDPFGSTRFDGAKGRFDTADEVIRAEIEASGLPPQLFKADADLRAAYLDGSTDVRRVILVLTDQPVAETSASIWSAHDAALSALSEQLRTEADAAEAARLAQASEDLREAVRSLIDGSAEAEVVRSSSAVRDALAAKGVDAEPLSFTLNALVASVPVNRLMSIVAETGVALVVGDEAADLQLSTSVPTTGQPSYANAGYAGGTEDVAVADSGVDLGHPALSGRTRVESRTHFPSGQSDPCFADTSSTDDLHGHGTHVAGIVGSLGSAASPNDKGMMAATSAGLINVKSAFLCGTGAKMYWSDAIANIDWAIRSSNNKADHINLSFGGGNDSGNSAMALFLDAVSYAKKIPVSVSAGNNGAAGSSTVTDPGTAYNVITVGNARDFNTVSRSDDVLTPGSSRGPTSDGRRKPDIVAPGSSISSTNAFWEGAGADFVGFTGTSMAAPHVAGAGAVAASAGISGALRWKTTVLNAANGTELGGSGAPDNNIGFGYMDLSRHHSWYKVNDFFKEGTLTPASPLRFVRLASPAASSRVTLGWERHVTYNNGSPPAGASVLSDLDLLAYAESSNASLASSASVINNSEFLRGSDFSNAIDNVLVIKASSFGGGISAEPWALAASSDLSVLSGPALSLSDAVVPTRFANAGSGTVKVRVTNTGDLKAHDVAVTLNLPAGFTTATPSRTAGAVPPGGSVELSWLVTGPASCGSSTFTFSSTTSSYGQTLSATPLDVAVRVNCRPAVTVASPNGGENLNGTRTVSWTMTDADGDALSATAEVSANGGSSYAPVCNTASSSCSWNTAGSADGTNYLFRVRSADGWDVGSDVSNASFTVDNTTPAHSIEVGGTLGDSGWYRSNVAVSLPCTDATSGVAPNGVSYSLNGGPASTYSSPFTLSGEGTTAIASSCSDRATNVTARNRDVRIDKTSPSVVLNNPVLSISDITIAWAASDAVSGLTGSISVQESANGGSFVQVCAQPLSGSSGAGSCVRRVTTGYYCYRATARDVAGNSTLVGTSFCTLKVS